MRWIISKFRAVFTAFAALVASIVRGKTVALEPESASGETAGVRSGVIVEPKPVLSTAGKVVLEPEPSHLEPASEVSVATAQPTVIKPWLADIRRMAFLAVRGVTRLDLRLYNPPTDCPFQDLIILVFLEGELYGIEYVVKKDGVKFVSRRSCQLLLEPYDEWHRARINARSKGNNSLSSAERIELSLEQDGSKQTFVRSDNDFFLPVATRAA